MICDILRIWILATVLALEAGAITLSQVALQDLSGQGDSLVQYQTTDVVRVRTYSESSTQNRKAMFLFDVTSFGGRDLADQYVHSASFRLVANENCDEGWFRLYGFTDTAGGNDSSWHEGIKDQAHPDWPVVYNGRGQYPAGTGVRWLDTREGPGVGLSVSFSNDVLRYVRWAVGRDPAFGHSLSNADGRITLLLAMQNEGSSSYFYARESSFASYRPVLTLDVRFPALGMTLGGGAVTNQGLYDYGTFEDLDGQEARDWVLTNEGEALSSLHVTEITLAGADAWAFGLTLPEGQDFYLNSGQATEGCAVRFDPGGAYGAFDDARVIVTSNDPNTPVFTVHLRAVHQPAPPAVQIVDPAGWFRATSNAVTVYQVAGTANRHVVGHIVWSGEQGAGGAFPAATNWSAGIPLAAGWNDLAFVASNTAGDTVTAAVTIVRQPAEGLAPGDVAVVGWSRHPIVRPGQMVGSALLLGTLARVPAGTVVYATDNGGSSNGWFFGASEEQAAGVEQLCAVVFREPVSAGQLLNSHVPDARWTWVASGRIAVTSMDEYALPQLGPYDQIYLFQSGGPNPLFRPERHVFVLDDTGAFEEPVDAQTGNVPPGLEKGATALTFDLPFQPDLLHYDFEAYPDWMRTRGQWTVALADSDQWRQEQTGILPAGRFLVGDLALLDVQRKEQEITVAFSCAHAGRGYRLCSTADIQSHIYQEEAQGMVVPGRIVETLPLAAGPACFFQVKLDK